MDAPKVEVLTGVLEQKGPFGSPLRNAVTRHYRGDEIQETRRVQHDLYGPVEEAILRIREATKDLNDARFTTEYVYGSYGDTDREVVVIEGWKPMTDADKAERARLRQQKDDEARRSRAGAVRETQGEIRREEELVGQICEQRAKQVFEVESDSSDKTYTVTAFVEGEFPTCPISYDRMPTCLIASRHPKATRSSTRAVTE